MANDTTITIVGNLTDDPELRFTPNGAAVANFTVASTPRFLDKTTNEWKDGDALFLRCSIWRQAAENVAESLHRGMRVIVTGRLKQRSYETKEGEKRTVYEVEVDEIGPSLKYATAKVNKIQRSGGGGGFGGGGGQSTVVAASAAAHRPRTRGRRRHRPARPTSPLSSDHFPPSSDDRDRHSWPRHRHASRRRRSACSARTRSPSSTTRTPTLLRKFVSDRGKIRARRVSRQLQPAPA